MSQQGLGGLTNPFVTRESTLGPISVWAATVFSLTVYELTVALWADEFIRHVGKEFLGLFLSSHRLNFP